MKYSFLFFATCTLVCSLWAGGGDFRFPVQVQVEQGTLEGNYDTKTGVQTYLGVPYATPPLGDLRWKAPQPLSKWEGVRAAKSFGPRPMQAPVFSDMIFRSPGLSEDCLYLNIWTPAKSGEVALPTLVYFFGGGCVAGDSSEPRYDGASMAAKGIVAVTVNYRLNIFGFLAHPELSAESPYHGSGNYGLLDQQAALAWIQKNIAAFGGDPKKVTIAGESAGSISVSYQMASPLSKTLFARAIGESGAGILPSDLAPIPLAEAEQKGKEFFTKAGIASIAAAKKLSARAIYELYNQAKRPRFQPVVDGYFLKKTVPDVFQAHEQAQVPLLVGWNSAERPGSNFMQDKPYTAAAFLARVKEVYPKNFEAILKVYPHSPNSDIEASATALASDRFIAYATWHWFDLHRKNSDQPVYRYLFGRIRPPLKDSTSDANPAQSGSKRPPASPPIGAPHATEIEYCMGNLSLNPDYSWTGEDFKVSQIMEAYFANFIKTGNPNGDLLPTWPPSKPDDASPSVMLIGDRTELKPQNDERYRVLQQIDQTP